MPAPARVSIEAIKDALQKTGGNTTHSAALLMMSRNNLIKRLEVAGIDVNSYRNARSAPSNPRTLHMAVVRLRAESQEKMRQAGFDLAAVQRREYTPAQVLEEFIADAFDRWLASKLAEKGGRS